MPATISMIYAISRGYREVLDGRLGGQIVTSSDEFELEFSGSSEPEL